MICLLLRDFAIIQERILNPALSDESLILIEAGKYRPKVIAPDAQARQMGVKAGMWLKEAQTLCPMAQFLAVEETRYHRLFMDMTKDLLNITERIEPEYQPTSAAWYTDDDLMLPILIEAIEKYSHIKAQVGIASTKFPARVAAAITCAGEIYRVEATQEAIFLSKYPVSLLPLDKLMQRRLPLLGIQTLGQYAALPRLAAWEQFGKHGRWLHDLANGKDIRPLHPFKVPPTISSCQPFDEAISDRQILHRVLEKLSLHLYEQLDAREAHQILLIVNTTKHSVLEHQRQPPKPIRDNLYLFRLVSQMLDALPIQEPIETIEIRLANIRERLPIQLSLFDRKDNIKRLEEIAPVWVMRYREADFYRVSLTGDEHLPERMIDKQKVNAG